MTTWTHPRHPLVAANADIVSGQPRINGHRIATCWIAARFKCGASVRSLAREFADSTDRAHIEAALRFELDASAKRAWRKWWKGK